MKSSSDLGDPFADFVGAPVRFNPSGETAVFETLDVQGEERERAIQGMRGLTRAAVNAERQKRPVMWAGMMMVGDVVYRYERPIRPEPLQAEVVDSKE